MCLLSRRQDQIINNIYALRSRIWHLQNEKLINGGIQRPDSSFRYRWTHINVRIGQRDWFDVYQTSPVRNSVRFLIWSLFDVTDTLLAGDTCQDQLLRPRRTWRQHSQVSVKKAKVNAFRVLYKRNALKNMLRDEPNKTCRNGGILSRGECHCPFPHTGPTCQEFDCRMVNSIPLLRSFREWRDIRRKEVWPTQFSI